MKLPVFISFLILSFANLAQDLLSPEMLWNLKRVGQTAVSVDGQFIAYTVTTYDVQSNKGNTDIFIYTVAEKSTKQITQTPSSEFDLQWSNTSLWYARSENGEPQVYQWVPSSGTEQCMTSFKDKQIQGFKIAPDESSLLTLQAVKFKKTIQETYSDLPLANARVEDDLMYRHWNAWDDGTKIHLFYHKPVGQDNRSPGFLPNGRDLLQGEEYHAILPPFGGMENISYTFDSQGICYTSKKLNGKSFAESTNSELFYIDLERGRAAVLTTGYKGYDTHPTFSTNQTMAWLSMKNDGFESDKNDIILRYSSGQPDKNLTAKMDVSVSEYVWHPDGKRIFFIAPTQGTKQLFEMNVESGISTQITQGMYDIVSVSASQKFLVVGRQSMLEPTELFMLKPITRKKITTWEMEAITALNQDVMTKLAKPSIMQRWVETTDGKKMLSWVILPPNFDKNKKYPTLLYCQGGPQSPVSQFFSYRWNFMLMASQGYIVVAPNRRGLPGFGQEWNDAISKDWGGQAMADYLAAIDDACKIPQVDKDRLGAVGASYGGYSVYYLAGIHENRFKTFVSHCGLFNLESWYGTTEELFFANWDNQGPYWIPENKSYYEKNSPHKFVQNWNTPMLVIHGGKDFRVPESEGMQAYQAAQIMGIKSRLLYFPEEGHWVLKPQNGLVWHREFFRWLDEDLLPG